MTPVPNAPCRVCEERNFRLWGRKGGVDFYQCGRCDLVFSYPYPTQEALDAFYAESYHQERGYDGSGEAGRARLAMYETDIRDLDRQYPAGGRILDVGCAEGVFLSRLDPSKWRRHGIDCSPAAIRNAMRQPGVTAEVKSLTEMPDRSFDIVHLRGVLEHLLDPLEAFRQAHRVLAPGGHLVLSNTPNIGGPVPRLFRTRFRLVLPNEHIHYFSPETMRLMAARTRFHIQRIRYPYFGTPYASPLKDVLSIPWRLATGGESPPFWGNIFSIYLDAIDS